MRGFGGGPGVLTVHVWAYPANGGDPTFVGSNYGRPRSDVAALFGSSYLNSGYQMTVKGLPVGAYILRASAYDLRTGDFSLVAERRVTVAGGTPFGVFDTPAPGASVAGTVLVTGWALSGVGVTRVALYRDPIGAETERIWIGDARFVEGTRPDVAAAFPGYPQNTRAGWGLAVLTNLLPNGGNGPITFHAYAYDANNNVTLLGSRTVTGTNQSSVLPFGTLDTPGQGGTVSGTLTIFGWALTPGPNIIPTDGSTIQVIVDGVVVGQPTYNQCRGSNGTNFPPPGTCNDDIATAFGLAYRNIAEGTWRDRLLPVGYDDVDQRDSYAGMAGDRFSGQQPGDREPLLLRSERRLTAHPPPGVGLATCARLRRTRRRTCPTPRRHPASRQSPHRSRIPSGASIAPRRAPFVAPSSTPQPEYPEQFGHRFLRQAARPPKLREVQILGETLRLRLNTIVIAVARWRWCDVEARHLRAASVDRHSPRRNPASLSAMIVSVRTAGGCFAYPTGRNDPVVHASVNMRNLIGFVAALLMTRALRAGG